MQPVLTVQAIRDAESEWFDAHPGKDLMRVAADAVARHARRMLGGRPGRVLVLAGAGNNAGDALYAAASLAGGGGRVTAWRVFGDTHAAGLDTAVAAGVVTLDDLVAALTDLAEADLVIDGLFGIGGRPGLPDEVATFAAAVADLGVPVLAVDLPSGLDADSHADHACLAATETVTFIAPKFCHVGQPAAGRCGVVHVVDIGVQPPPSDVHVLEEADIARLWPWPGPTSDKYSRGVVGLDTGSQEYTGAAVLGAVGATHAGAGMVRYAGPDRPADLIRQRLPSVVFGAGRVQAWVCGSGWGDATTGQQRLAARVADGVPVLVDADALRFLPDHLPDNSLLTPHAGELARLLGVEREAVTADPLGHARRAAAEHRCTVLLKGATQYAVTPDGDVLIGLLGPAWTAQAGSGDTLAGIAGTLLAAGLTAPQAAALAASVQGRAAARRPGPWPPDAVAETVADYVGVLPR